MTLFDLVARISLDTTEYDNGLTTASGKFKTFGSSLKSGFGKILKTGATAIAGAAVAVAGFGASSVKTGMDFDKSMSQVAATMGKTMKEMENEVGEVDLAWGHFSGNLRDYAQEMGANTSFSATQAADALNYMALAGYSTQKSMQMLPNVLNLAAAGAMDLATASDMVTDASTALGLTEKETTEMVDQMAQASSKSNTSVQQLGDAMLRVGGTAKLLKGGTQELSTALGILADNGTKGAEGGTALRNILMSISSKKFEKSFGELGVSAYDADGHMRNLKDVFLDMDKAMQGMSDKEKTDIIKSAFNARDLKNVNALLGTSATRWDELSKAIGDSEGAAQQMADTQLDNLAGDITLLKSAFEGAQIAVSDKLSPSLRKFVQSGSEGISKFTELMKDGDMSGAISSLGETFGSLASMALGKVPDMVSAGIELIKGVGIGIAKEAPKLATEFIKALPDLGKQVMGIFDSLPNIGEKLTELFSSLPDVGTQIGRAFESLPDLGGKFVKMFEGIDFVSIATNLVTGFMNVFSSFSTNLVPAGAEFIKSISTGFVEGIPEFLSNILPMFLQFTEYIRSNAGMLVDAGLEFITNLAQGIINSIPVLIAYIPEIITNIAGVINDNAPKIMMTGLNIIKNLAIGIVKGVPVIVSNIPKIITAIWNVFLAFNWVNIGSTIINGIVNGVKALGSYLPQTLKNIGQTAIEWLSAIQWSTLGADIIDLISIGISSLASAIPQALSAIAKTASTIFKGIDWVGVGKTVITLLSGAIKGAGSLVMGALKTAGKKGYDAFKNINWKGVGKTVVTFIGSAIRGAGRLILTALRTAGTSAMNAFKSINWAQLGSNIISGIVRGIGGAAGSLFNKLRGLASDALGAAKRALKIGSPSKLFRDEVGKQIPAGMAIGIDKGRKYVSKAMDDLNTLTMSSIPDYDMGYSSDVPSFASFSDSPYATIEVPEGTEGNRVVKNVTVNNYITVDGARDPEEYTEQLVRSIRQQVRMA